MNIELHNITVAQLCEGFIDSDEEGVRAFGGKLDIRPPYQREFIYKGGKTIAANCQMLCKADNRNKSGK